MNDITNSAQYLRAQVTLPKLTGIDYYKTSQHRLAYEQLIGTIWRAIIKQLEDPITITEGKTSRRVEVLGITRYYVNHRTQQVTCRTKEGQCMEDDWQFSFKPTSNVLVDPPFSCNKTIIGYFVHQWRVNQHAILSRLVVETASNSFHLSMSPSSVLAGGFWSDLYGHDLRNTQALFSTKTNDYSHRQRHGAFPSHRTQTHSYC